ncbi:MAG: hypothetical protein J3K34DRAFT_442850 [Monoraphidium minutum]|nr:MAG: hypothetical protein J3K34DRAFT_442850 [Monoraphidium minutum]
MCRVTIDGTKCDKQGAGARPATDAPRRPQQLAGTTESDAGRGCDMRGGQRGHKHAGQTCSGAWRKCRGKGKGRILGGSTKRKSCPANCCACARRVQGGERARQVVQRGGRGERGAEVPGWHVHCPGSALPWRPRALRGVGIRGRAMRQAKAGACGRKAAPPKDGAEKCWGRRGWDKAQPWPARALGGPGRSAPAQPGAARRAGCRRRAARRRFTRPRGSPAL